MRVGVLSLCGASFFLAQSANAGQVSSTTIKYAENVRSVAHFLDRSSRLAVDNSHSGKVKRFAKSEAAEQTAAINSVTAWSETALGSPSAPRAAKTPMGVLSVPLRTAGAVATEMADQMDDVSEGRSVAIDEPAPETRQPLRLKETVLPSESENLGKLSDLEGRQFDELYKSTQRDALLQLSTLYAAYIQNGEDAALRALAIRELPKVNESLSALGRI